MIAQFQYVLSNVPQKGTILDVGCGYGVLSNLISISYPNVHVIGIDTDANRIAVAQSTIGSRKNIQFKLADASTLDAYGTVDAVIFFDVLHHIPCNLQQNSINKALSSLKPNGTIIIKEINTYPKWQYLVNLFHDKALNGGPLCYRSNDEWKKLLQKENIMCQTMEYGLIYPHVLLYGNKK